MKAISVIILGMFLFVCTLNSFAQVRLGIIGGINSANLKTAGYGPVPDSSKARFTGVIKPRIGIFGIIRLNRFLSLRPELAYSQKGADMKLDSGFMVIDRPPGWQETYKTKSKITLGYLELPILVRFSAHLFNLRKEKENTSSLPVSLDLLAGPIVSYLVSSRKKDEVFHSVYSTNDTSKKYNYWEVKGGNGSFPGKSLNRWDWGAVFAAAVKIKLSQKTELFFEARQTFSLGNINNGHWYNSTIVFSNWWSGKIIETKPKITNANMFTASIGIITRLNFRKITPEK